MTDSFVQWKYLKRDSRFILCTLVWTTGILAACAIRIEGGGWLPGLAVILLAVASYATGHILAREAYAERIRRSLAPDGKGGGIEPVINVCDSGGKVQ